VAGGDGVSLTVPIGTNINTPAGDALTWDSKKASQLFTALRTDDTAAIKPIADEQAKKAAAA